MKTRRQYGLFAVSENMYVRPEGVPLDITAVHAVSLLSGPKAAHHSLAESVQQAKQSRKVSVPGYGC